MHIIAASGKYIVCCGRHLVFVFSRKHTSPQLFVLDMMKAAGRFGVPAVARGSLCCADISKNSKFISVADTEKHVFVFERVGDNHWDFQYSFELEKKCTKLMFNARSTAILALGKYGDIWLGNMTVAAMQNPVKLFNHGCQLLDLVFSSNNRDIVFCAQDGKIFTSVLHRPTTEVTVDNILVGHRSPVVSIAFVENEHKILSAEALGELRLWTTKDSRCVATFDMLPVCDIPAKTGSTLKEGEIMLVKLSEALDCIWLAVRIAGMKEAPILRLKVSQRDLKKVSQVKLDSDSSDLTWCQESLFVVNMEDNEVLNKFDITNHGLMCDAKFRIPNLVEYAHDLKAFVLFNKQVSRTDRLSGTATPIQEEAESIKLRKNASSANKVRRNVSFATAVPIDDDSENDSFPVQIKSMKSSVQWASNE